MAKAAQPIIPITTPDRSCEGHEGTVSPLVVFPDGRRTVTGSKDKTLCLWELKVGIVLKKLKGHTDLVEAVVVSGDGKLIASGDKKGGLIA
ncbi:hypothetical protein AZE42_06018 [Rhizopogon vesiculosus]|uniref:Uncharacterized protein n=1 Tax=Rhizopogon vesiculosus TaxID=180088 RepID=A0A1J8PT00_9AGAM|nr:hypothetical protein AZE42_06018 [Rhizopogon vesiculosus]